MACYKSRQADTRDHLNTSRKRPANGPRPAGGTGSLARAPGSTEHLSFVTTPRAFEKCAAVPGGTKLHVDLASPARSYSARQDTHCCARPMAPGWRPRAAERSSFHSRGVGRRARRARPGDARDHADLRQPGQLRDNMGGAYCWRARVVRALARVDACEKITRYPARCTLLQI